MLTEKTSLVAVVDDWSRPVQLLEWHGLTGARALPAPMRCHSSCDVREALQRALTRDPATRFHPILLTDDEGKFCGVVRVDQMMRAVMDQATP